MKDSHKDCLRWTLFIYICAANGLEICMLFINLKDKTCWTHLSSVSMNMISYFIGFFIPAVGSFLFLLIEWWVDCLTGLPLSFNPRTIIRMMFASMLWRFIWVAVGELILFIDLIPKNQCSSAILMMEIDFYCFNTVLCIMFLVFIIDNIMSCICDKRKVKIQEKIKNQSQTMMDEISKNIDFSI